MHDYIDAVSNSFVYSGTVADISFDELKIFVVKAFGDVAAFDFRVVKIIEIVKSDYRLSVSQKAFAKM